MQVFMQFGNFSVVIGYSYCVDRFRASALGSVVVIGLSVFTISLSMLLLGESCWDTDDLDIQLIDFSFVWCWCDMFSFVSDSVLVLLVGQVM